MRMLIAGEWVEKPQTLEVRNPYDDSVVDTVPAGDAGDVDRAIAAACRGFEAMRAMPALGRAAILNRTAALLRERGEELARTLTREVGKTIREARVEAARAAFVFEIAAGEAQRLHGETVPFDAAPGGENRFGYFVRVPIGVVVAITPFNVPLTLAAHKVAPALAAGNAVVLKPATATPLADLMLGQALLDAGLPPEAINIVTGSGSVVGDALVSDPRPRMVSFTGSREVGESLTRKAGFKKVTLELGGNAACIITESADLDAAAAAVTRGSFSLAGQICISVQRVLVHRMVWQEFTDRFLARVAALKVGDPMDESTDVGPMIEEGAASRTEEWVGEAVAAGGKVLAGGTRRGALFAPTVLVGVPYQARLCSQEVFAPVVALMPFDTFDDAIALSNASLYGLQAGIFTGNLAQAMEATRRLDVGGVMVNDVPTYRADLMPYGGVKYSGLGREGVRFALEEMTEPRVVCINL